MITPAPYIVEFNADDYWFIFIKTVKEILLKSGVEPGAIKAISISSQAETLICVDRNGQPLRNAIVWLDNRSGAEADMIRQEFGTETVFGITGQPEVVATWPATKILWLRENEADVYKKTYKYLLLEDYLIHKLTGRYFAERSLLSSSLYMDIRTGGWWKEMLDYIGISPDHLPQAMESGEPVGRPTDEAASETGLCRDMLVVTGALDQLAGMIGAGNIHDDMVTETTGAAMAVCANISKTAASGMITGIPCQYHAISGKYCLMLWSQTAGMVLKWFREAFMRLDTIR